MVKMNLTIKAAAASQKYSALDRNKIETMLKKIPAEKPVIIPQYCRNRVPYPCH